MQLSLSTRDDPLGVFTGENIQLCTIQGPQLALFMQSDCEQAYPDPSHFHRINIQLFQAHSLRITACVALDNAGVSHEQIAFRLQWNSEAIKVYLHDGVKHIGEITRRAVIGVSQHAERTSGEPSPPTDSNVNLNAPNVIYPVAPTTFVLFALICTAQTCSRASSCLVCMNGSSRTPTIPVSARFVRFSLYCLWQA
jgi:hypothetical protein